MTFELSEEEDGARIRTLLKTGAVQIETDALKRSKWYPHYTSSACIHDLHAQCRNACKHCAQSCRCSCHAAIGSV